MGVFVVLLAAFVHVLCNQQSLPADIVVLQLCRPKLHINFHTNQATSYSQLISSGHYQSQVANTDENAMQLWSLLMQWYSHEWHNAQPLDYMANDKDAALALIGQTRASKSNKIGSWQPHYECRCPHTIKLSSPLVHFCLHLN